MLLFTYLSRGGYVMQEQMWTVKEIADHFHTNTQRIYRIMARLEIAETNIQKNVKYYDQGKFEAIAKELGLDDNKEGKGKSDKTDSSVDVIEAQKSTIDQLEKIIEIRDKQIEESKAQVDEAKSDKDLEVNRLHAIIQEQMEANERTQTLLSQEQQLQRGIIQDLDKKRQQLTIASNDLTEKEIEIQKATQEFETKLSEKDEQLLVLEKELEEAKRALEKPKKSGLFGFFKR